MANVVSVRRTRIHSRAPAPSSYLETRRATFADPWDVVLDPNLTSREKLEILSDWSSAAKANDGLLDEQVAAAGAASWWDDLVEGLRLVEAEIAALSRPRTVARPGHLKPSPRSRSSHAA